MPKKAREKFKTYEDVFDQFTLQNIFKLGRYFDEETLSPVSIGKESNVFSATARVGNKERIIVKIHRLETSDFNNIYYYIRNDPRFTSLKKRRREVIFAWAQREYRNLLAARQAEVKAPMPIAFLKNIIIMELIGDKEAAPQVKDSVPENPTAFFKGVVENIKRYYKAGFVHGDLSKFNILNHKEIPVLIDFSQATPLKSPVAAELLRRDAVNVADFFRRRGVKTDAEKVLALIKSTTATKK